MRRIALILAIGAMIAVMAVTSAAAIAQELLPESHIPSEPGPTEAHPSICHAKAGPIEAFAC